MHIENNQRSVGTSGGILPMSILIGLWGQINIQRTVELMFVVKTIQQLEAAIQDNVQEIMIVGEQALEMLEAIFQPIIDKDRNLLSPFATKLNDAYSVSELHYNEEVTGFLHQKSSLLDAQGKDS